MKCAVASLHDAIAERPPDLDSGTRPVNVNARNTLLYARRVFGLDWGHSNDCTFGIKSGPRITPDRSARVSNATRPSPFRIATPTPSKGTSQQCSSTRVSLLASPLLGNYRAPSPEAPALIPASELYLLERKTRPPSGSFSALPGSSGTSRRPYVTLDDFEFKPTISPRRWCLVSHCLSRRFRRHSVTRMRSGGGRCQTYGCLDGGMHTLS